MGSNLTIHSSCDYEIELISCPAFTLQIELKQQ